MNQRVAKLRQESLNTRPWLSLERAALITEFYRAAKIASAPLRRAGAFQYLMENQTIHLGTGELIVGERGPRPKGTPTFPELCCHSIGDFEILHTREKISYGVPQEAFGVQSAEIIP